MVQIVPPLVITRRQLAASLQILEEALASCLHVGTHLARNPEAP